MFRLPTAYYVGFYKFHAQQSVSSSHQGTTNCFLFAEGLEVAVADRPLPGVL